MENTAIYNTTRSIVSDDIRADESLPFRSISYADIPVILEHIKRYPSKSDDFSIGGIMMWVDYYNYQYCIVEDTLFIKAQEGDDVFFYMPLGAMPMDKAVERLRNYCNRNDIDAYIVMPDECGSDIYSDTTSENMDDLKEYLYDIEAFKTFAGRKMEKKRNHLHYFQKNYADAVISDITDDDIEILKEFTDKFNLYHKENETFEYESEATVAALDKYAEFPFYGIKICLGNEVLGYTFGEANGDTFFVHVEKGNIDYRGIYQALSCELSKRVAESYPDVRFLNREEDMGNEFLRQSKMSYHPVEFVTKWKLRLAGA